MKKTTGLKFSNYSLGNNYNLPNEDYTMYGVQAPSLLANSTEYSNGAKALNATSGALSGAATGATLGSFIPGIGNVVGGLVGAGVGALGSYMKSKEEEAAAKKAKEEEEKRYQKEFGYREKRDIAGDRKDLRSQNMAGLNYLTDSRNNAINIFRTALIRG